ncbi:MAG: ABC transporter permease [Dehalococcoidia bacterium]|nr:MAG: ABC transporter permease [Dehalococcoidia bacterium]
MFVVRRLLQTVPVLVLVSMAVFSLVRLVPGGPGIHLIGANGTEADLQRVNHQLGLDQSLPRQYVHWVGDAMRGNLQVSLQRGLDVTRLMRLALPTTLELALCAFVVSVGIGIPLGVMAGVHPGSRWDWLLAGFTGVTIGIPNFLMGIVLLWLFGVKLHWLPIVGSGATIFQDPVAAFRPLILPTLSLGFGSAAVLARYTRTSVQGVMSQDFIRTARAKGLPEHRVIIQHGLRAALIPVVTVVALQVGRLLTGAIVVETVFTRPGLGRTLVQAIEFRDYPVVQGMLLFLVVIFIVVNLMADVAYGMIDPRVRVQ